MGWKILYLIKDFVLGLIDIYTGVPQVQDDEDEKARPLYDIVEELVIRYTQRKWSELYDAIQRAGGLTKSETIYSAKRACKVVCFYIELIAKGILKPGMDLEAFLLWSYTNGTIDKRNSKMLVTQKSFYSKLKDAGLIDKNAKFVDIDILPSFITYNRYVNWVGKVRIFTGYNKDGEKTFHSMMTYNKNGSIRIADPNRRGIDIPLEDAVNYKNFRYFTEWEVL